MGKEQEPSEDSLQDVGAPGSPTVGPSSFCWVPSAICLSSNPPSAALIEADSPHLVPLPPTQRSGLQFQELLGGCWPALGSSIVLNVTGPVAAITSLFSSQSTTLSSQ